MVKSQVPDPEQSPDHPTNTEPASGVALRDIFVPEKYVLSQVTPQLIPEPETNPVPVPAFDTNKLLSFPPPPPPGGKAPVKYLLG